MPIDREVPEGTRTLAGDAKKLGEIWDRISSISGVFDDYARGRPDMFLSLYFSPDTWWLEREDGNGILYLTKIVPRLSAQAHVIYWDKRLRGREAFTLNCLLFAVNAFDLQKINVILPEFAGAAVAFTERLGFKKEGLVRNWSYSNSKLYGVYFYGMTREEVTNGTGHLSATADSEHSEPILGHGSPNSEDAESGTEPTQGSGDAVQPVGSGDLKVLDRQEPGVDTGLSIEDAPNRGD
jgi:hypothetical protein